MATVREAYGHIALELIKNSVHSSDIDPDAVYQEANKSNRKILNKITADLVLPESEFLGYHELQKLYYLAQEGKSCLILMEHYSNFDLPNLFYLIEHFHPDGEEIAESIIAMAGMKLNVESEFVKAFTEAFTRLVIYPSRSLAALEGSENYAAERTLSRRINMAALHEMVRQKHAGRIILLFPSGTRYRPGVEETRRGLAEVDSYIKGFDYILPIAIAGNTLRINLQGSMSEDYVHKDCMILKAGKVKVARDWRNSVRGEAPEGADIKQFVADKVMELLARLHDEAEEYRRGKLPPEYSDA